MNDAMHATKACKEKTFPPREEYYHIFFLGTLPSARGQRLCSAIIKHYQAIATEARKPIWMEAGSEYCMGLYRSHGFEVVEELNIAVGKADKDGRAAEGGEGFRIWGMVWRPETGAEAAVGTTNDGNRNIM